MIPVDKQATTTAAATPNFSKDIMDILIERAAKRGYPVLQPEQRLAEDNETHLCKFTKTNNADSDALWVGLKGENVIYEPTNLTDAANSANVEGEVKPLGTEEPKEQLHAATADNKQRGIQQRAARHRPEKGENKLDNDDDE